MVVEVVGNHCLKNNRDNIQYQQIKTKLVELGEVWNHGIQDLARLRNGYLKKFKTTRRKITQKQDFETYHKGLHDFKIRPKFSKTHVF